MDRVVREEAQTPVGVRLLDETQLAFRFLGKERYDGGSSLTELPVTYGTGGHHPNLELIMINQRPVGSIHSL